MTENNLDLRLSLGKRYKELLEEKSEEFKRNTAESELTGSETDEAMKRLMAEAEAEITESADEFELAVLRDYGLEDILRSAEIEESGTGELLDTGELRGELAEEIAKETAEHKEAVASAPKVVEGKKLLSGTRTYKKVAIATGAVLVAALVGVGIHSWVSNGSTPGKSTGKESVQEKILDDMDYDAIKVVEEVRNTGNLDLCDNVVEAEIQGSMGHWCTIGTFNEFVPSAE